MGIELLLRPKEVQFGLVYGMFREFKHAYKLSNKYLYHSRLRDAYTGFYLDAHNKDSRCTLLFEPTPELVFMVSGGGVMTVFRGFPKEDFNRLVLGKEEPRPILKERYFFHRARKKLEENKYDGILVPDQQALLAGAKPAPQFTLAEIDANTYKQYVQRNLRAH